MKRTITVKGVGKASVRPDYVVLNITLNAVNKDYEAAAALSAEQTESVKAAAEKAGFERGDVKTADYRIFTEYESVMDEKGFCRNEFAGYRCVHQLRISFDFKQERLAGILSAVGACEAQPEINILFTVKDTGAVSSMLLRDAAKSAKKKARVLCAESGVKLGRLVSIDYNWNEKSFASNTCFEMGSCAPMRAGGAKFRADIAPDDISVSDSAAFVWEIE